MIMHGCPGIAIFRRRLNRFGVARISCALQGPVLNETPMAPTLLIWVTLCFLCCCHRCQDVPELFAFQPDTALNSSLLDDVDEDDSADSVSTLSVNLMASSSTGSLAPSAAISAEISASAASLVTTTSDLPMMNITTVAGPEIADRVVNALRTADPDSTEDGYWVVFDQNATMELDPSHQRPASCLLARMKLRLVLNDTMVTAGDVIGVPAEAVATNGTCNQDQQSLILTWTDSDVDKFNLTLVFSRAAVAPGAANTSLSRVMLQVDHRDEQNSTEVDHYVVQADSLVNLMQMPRFYAFCCDRDFHISFTSNISYYGMGFQELGTSQILTTLVLSQFCIEPFRELRFYDDITHLRFDCDAGHPDPLIQQVVVLSCIVLSATSLMFFVVRYKRS